MARVPSPTQVSSGDIQPSRTVSPQITENRGLSVGAQAFAKLGQTTQDAGDQQAQIGIIEARKDEAREVQARTIRFKQDLFDLTYGNEDKKITGYRELKGQAALDGDKE